jgi:hypothetical protein
MSDQPETHHKPQFAPALVGWIVASGAAAMIAAALLAAGAPPSPYSNLLVALIVAAVVVGAVLFLTGVVFYVSERFGDRYDRTEESIKTYQREMTMLIGKLAERQNVILARIRELDSRAQRICGDQQVLHNKVNRCMGEVSMVNEGLSELREAFVEEGLPERDQLGTGRRGPGSRAGYHSILTRSGSNRYPFHSFAG